MADPTVFFVDPPPYLTGDFDPGLHIPPLDPAFFSENLLFGGGAPGDIQNDDVSILEDLDFDFSFDDLCIPSSDDPLNPTPRQQPGSQTGPDADLAEFGSNLDQFHAVFKSNNPELRHTTGGGDFPGDRSWEGSSVLSFASPEMGSQQISGYLNVPSPESNGSNRGSAENCGKVSNCNSPESQGYGNFNSNVSDDSDNCATRSVSSSPDSIKTDVVGQKIKLEEMVNKTGKSSLLKRKKEVEEKLMDDDDNFESRTNKYRKSDCSEENNISSSNNNEVESIEEDEKRKARLLRNRESAQLSRQRKKHYVEELEDKVRNMHSTIQDLNAKISFFMAENATLRQQMSCSGGTGGGGAVPPPPMAPPPPGMYTPPAMMYPWMPCPLPYMVKPQGSQVPLIPIPRLRTQKPTQAPKTSKKGVSKKNEGTKTMKVASISFLGLLFFIMLFGGLVPMVNVRYGGVREALMGGGSYGIGVSFSQKHSGRVLMVNGTEYGEKKHGGFRDSSSNSSVDDFVRSGNESEPLAASLYVPRNDKLVKIDGNLIIHSVLATEKAMASRVKEGGETGLVVPGNLAPAISVSSVGRNGVVHRPHLRALGSSSVDNDSVKSKSTTNGRLQQWFQEGLAGPMLSSGMCTEVFQFDISAAGAIIPATTTQNISKEKNQNTTHPKNGRNRRILSPEPSRNISKEHASSEKDNLHGNKNTSSMVVSVLFDPREVGDGDVDGVMGTKSVPRIFVVVLTDSVKYVTYSCMLPFAGSAPHVVTA